MEVDEISEFKCVYNICKIFVSLSKHPDHNT